MFSFLGLSGDMTTFIYLGIIVLLSIFTYKVDGFIKVKQILFLFMFFGLHIYALIVHLSNEFIKWLNPNVVSMLDERWLIQLEVLVLNYFLILFLWKTKMKKYVILTLIGINTILLVYYFLLL